MGGLAIRAPENLPKSKISLFNPQETYFITPKGVEWLLNETNVDHNELADLLEEDIKTKSKANGLAKAFVCTQALWFVAQCLTRRK